MNKPQEPEISVELKEYLGEFGIQFGSEEFPTAWGFKIIKHLGEEKWVELGRYGKKEFIQSDYNPLVGNWYLITHFLTREEAVKLFGPITKETFGPRGGWRSVTFGTKTFYSRQFKVHISESPAPIKESA